LGTVHGISVFLAMQAATPPGPADLSAQRQDEHVIPTDRRNPRRGLAKAGLGLLSPPASPDWRAIACHRACCSYTGDLCPTLTHPKARSFVLCHPKRPS
jgi:hypothetical protein